MSVMTKTGGEWIYERVNAALACAVGTQTEAKHRIGGFRDRGETCWLDLVPTVRGRALMAMLGMIEGEWRSDAVWKWVQGLREEALAWRKEAEQIQREREERSGIDGKETEGKREASGVETQEEGETRGDEGQNSETQTESAEDVMRWMEGLGKGDKDMLTEDGE